MRVRYVIAGCAAGLALYLTALGAAGSPVADAAMKGDKAALRTLLQQKADVNLARRTAPPRSSGRHTRTTWIWPTC